MYEAIGSLFKKLFPSTETGRVIMLGLDASGKTTLLYRLKLGEVITTIPTIGFNVEEVVWPTSSGRLKVIAWDVGGCGNIGPLWKHYFQNTTGIIFVLDAHDRDRMGEAMSELSYFHISTEKEFDLKGIPFLVQVSISPSEFESYFFCRLANKQDLPNSMTNEEIMQMISALPNGAPPNLGIFSISAVAEKSAFNAQIQPALDWLAEQTKIRRVSTEPVPSASVAPSADPNPRSPEALAAKVNAWLGRLETDCTPDELLDQFSSLSLPAWDQYTHVRLAYVILTKFGRARGTELRS
jgi:small GTP-binding protein